MFGFPIRKPETGPYTDAEVAQAVEDIKVAAQQVAAAATQTRDYVAELHHKHGYSNSPLRGRAFESIEPRWLN